MNETKVEAEEPELEKCPLCPNGGKPYFTRTVNGTRMAYVGCSECGLELKAAVIMVTPVDEALSKDIVGIWNTRSRPTEAAEDAYVGWCRYVNHGQYKDSGADILTFEACDSDAPGAFKVWAAPTPSKPSTADRDHLFDELVTVATFARRVLDGTLDPSLNANAASRQLKAVLAKIDAAEKAGECGNS